jgi:hypothetical protein
VAREPPIEVAPATSEPGVAVRPPEVFSGVARRPPPSPKVAATYNLFFFFSFSFSVSVSFLFCLYIYIYKRFNIVSTFSGMVACRLVIRCLPQTYNLDSCKTTNTTPMPKSVQINFLKSICNFHQFREYIQYLV